MKTINKENSKSIKGLLLLLVSQFLLVFFPSFLVLFPISFFQTTNNGQYLLYIFLEVLLFFIPALLVFRKWKKEKEPFYTSFWHFPSWNSVFWLLVLSATGFFFFYHINVYWTFLLNALGATFPVAEFPIPSNNIELILAITAIGIAPAFCEELFFRGVLFNSLKRSFSLKWATWLTALLFAITHRSLAAFPVHIALGYLLTYFVVKTGSLSSSIIYHLFHNTINLLASTFIVKWVNQLPKEILTATSTNQVSNPFPATILFALLPTLIITGVGFVFALRKTLKVLPYGGNLTPQVEPIKKRPSFLALGLVVVSVLFMGFFYVLPFIL